MTGGETLAWIDRYLVTRHHRGAVGYLAERLLAPHGTVDRWRQALSRGLLSSRVELSLDPLGRLLGITPGDGGSLPERFRQPLRWLERALEKTVSPRPSGFVLLTDYRDHPRRGQVVAFLFDDHQGEPRAVLKLGAAETIGREAAALERLADLREPLAVTVPRSWGVLELTEETEDGSAVASPRLSRSILATSPFPGRSAYVEAARGPVWHPATLARHLELAARWLAAFQGATATPEPWRPPSPEDARWDPVRDARGAPPAWVRRWLRRLAARPVAARAAHGDFWARNLLVPRTAGGVGALPGGGSLPGVVDWEGFQPAGDGDTLAPVVDLFHFPWAYAEHLGRRRRWNGDATPEPERILERAFLGATPLAREVGRYFDLYLTHCGLPRSLLDPWFRLFLLHRAAGADAEDPPRKEAPWLRAYRRYDRAPRSVFSG